MKVAGQSSSRERLLEAGKKLFAERGFESATTAAIAKAARTSQSQLLKHFKDKHGVLNAVLDQAWQQLNPAVELAIERIGKPAEQLRLSLNMFLSAAQKTPTGGVLALDGGTLQDPNGRPFVSSGCARFAAILDGIVERMRLQGELRADIHPIAFRAMLMGCLEKFVRDRFAGSSESSPHAYAEADFQMIVLRLLAGCSAPKAAAAVEEAQAAAVPLEVAAAPEDDAWIRQYFGLAETLLKSPPGSA